MSHPLFTVGHSNRSIESFIDMLRAASIGMVVDVRRLPGSRAHPQFDSDRLAQSLAEAGIGYEYVASLGGRRGRAHDVAPDINGLWRNQSFHNYADYAQSDAFREGLARLRDLAARHRCAVMCSESVWWRCHRRIIADHLLAHGESVSHLMGEGRADEATPTQGAVFNADGSVTYPAAAAE